MSNQIKPITKPSNDEEFLSKFCFLEDDIDKMLSEDKSLLEFDDVINNVGDDFMNTFATTSKEGTDDDITKIILEDYGHYDGCGSVKDMFEPIPSSHTLVESKNKDIEQQDLDEIQSLLSLPMPSETSSPISSAQPFQSSSLSSSSSSQVIISSKERILPTLPSLDEKNISITKTSIYGNHGRTESEKIMKKGENLEAVEDSTVLSKDHLDEIYSNSIEKETEETNEYIDYSKMNDEEVLSLTERPALRSRVKEPFPMKLHSILERSSIDG